MAQVDGNRSVGDAGGVGSDVVGRDAAGVLIGDRRGRMEMMAAMISAAEVVTDEMPSDLGWQGCNYRIR